jgi:hypothetical protein
MIRFNKIEFTILCLSISSCLSIASAQASSDVEYLPTTEEQSEPNDSVVILKGAIQKISKQSSNSSMKELKAENGNSSSNQLNGQIDTSDGKPTEEVSIDWDKWRNRVTRSIWARFCEHLNGGDAIMFGNTVIKLGNAPIPRFPLGTSATYSFNVNSERQLSNVRITVSSGNQRFDRIILRSVQSIDGKQFLKFPKGSKRNLVSASAKLFTTKHGSFNNIAFGDIERYQPTVVP